MDLGGAAGDAHPSVGRPRIASALRRLHGRVLYIGVMTDACFEIARIIKQGCPSAGSVWALICDFASRMLCASMPWPRNEPSLFADDIAAMLAEVLARLPALLRSFDALRVATGFALNYGKNFVLNFGVLSGFMLKRRVLNATSGAQMLVAR